MRSSPSSTMLWVASALLVSFACGCAAEVGGSGPAGEDQTADAGAAGAAGAIGTVVERQSVDSPGYDPPAIRPIRPAPSPGGYGAPGACVPPAYYPPGYNPAAYYNPSGC